MQHYRSPGIIKRRSPRLHNRLRHCRRSLRMHNRLRRCRSPRLHHRPCYRCRIPRLQSVHFFSFIPEPL